MMRPSGTFSGIAVTLCLLLAGCGSDPGFNEATDFVRTEGGVQFVNMIADSPELTMIHGLNQSNVRFPFSGGVVTRFEDQYDWRIAYRTSNNDEITVDQGEDQQISERMLSTFLMMGSLSQPNIQIVDVPFLPISERSEGEAEFWFAANLSTVAMVDIYYTDFGEDITASTPLGSLDGVGFTPVFTVEPGETKQIRITSAGTSDLLFDSGSITVPGQSIDFFGLVDDFGPDSPAHVDVIRTTSSNQSTIEDVSQPTSARVTNFSSTTTVDTTIATTEYPGVTSETGAYQAITFGTQSFAISNSDTELLSDEVIIVSGEFYSLFIFDSAQNAEDAFTTVLVQDKFRDFRERAYFQFINGSNETIDVYALIDDQETDEVPPVLNDTPNIASGISEVPVGATRFVVTSADNSQNLGSAEVVLEEGVTYSVIYEQNAGLHVIQD